MKGHFLTSRVVGVALALFFTVSPSFACELRDFQVSTTPSPPDATSPFELVVDYQGSEGCVLGEELIVSPETLTFEISCDCPFVTTLAVPQQFRAPVSGLTAGVYAFEAIHVDNPPTPRTVATTQILIGQAPSIPISPLALTLLSLILASVAVSILRR